MPAKLPGWLIAYMDILKSYAILSAFLSVVLATHLGITCYGLPDQETKGSGVVTLRQKLKSSLKGVSVGAVIGPFFIPILITCILDFDGTAGYTDGLLNVLSPILSVSNPFSSGRLKEVFGLVCCPSLKPLVC
jgi:hypothetical protein